MFDKLVYLLIFLSVLSVPTIVFSQETPVITSQDAVVSNTNLVIKAPPSTPPPATRPINLSVSPISLNLVTDPGVEKNTAIKIRNNSDDPEFLQLRLATFTANPAGDSPIMKDFDENDQSKNWIKFSEDSFRISPGEWKTIQLKFSPPESAALGYYYAILVERQSEAESPEGTSLISGVPAILVLSEISSPLAKKQLELVSFKTNQRLYEYLPATFEVVIKNTGNIQTMPVGDIFIDGQRTTDLGIMQLNPAKGMILPGSQRTFTVNWDDGFPKFLIEENQFGEQNKVLKWDFSQADRLRIGKYTATTLFVYDDGQRDIPTEATVSFWVVPYRLFGLILLIILLDLFRSKIFKGIKALFVLAKAKVTQQ